MAADGLTKGWNGSFRMKRDLPAEGGWKPLVSCQAIKVSFGGAGGKAPAGGLGVSPRYYISPSPAGEGAGG